MIDIKIVACSRSYQGLIEYILVLFRKKCKGFTRFYLKAIKYIKFVESRLIGVTLKLLSI